MARPRKREEELAYPRSKNGKAKGVIEATHGEMREVRIPHGDGAWHPSAKRIYDSLRTSGQADFFQNSDWAYAHFLCGEISAYLNSNRRSAQMFAALLQGVERLLATEADRRKARIELQRPKVEETPVELIAIDGYRSALKGAAASAS